MMNLLAQAATAISVPAGIELPAWALTALLILREARQFGLIPIRGGLGSTLATPAPSTGCPVTLAQSGGAASGDVRIDHEKQLATLHERFEGIGTRIDGLKSEIAGLRDEVREALGRPAAGK